MTKIQQKGDARSPRLGHRPPSISSSGLTPRGEGNWDFWPIATKWANNSLLGPGSLVKPSDCSISLIFKILILIWERKSVSVCAHGQRISFGSQVSLPLGVPGTNAGCQACMAGALSRGIISPARQHLQTLHCDLWPMQSSCSQMLHLQRLWEMLISSNWF